MAILKPLEEFKTLRRSFTLIDKAQHKSKVRNLYKYMDLETALKCLKDRSIRFVEPSEWPDKYERHFYNADYSALTDDSEITPRIFACCFTTSKMSEASWNTYRYGKQGLGNKCVKIQISRSKFREFLRKDINVKCTYEGFMDYSISDYDIQHLHLKSSSFYSEVFSQPFTLDKYLSLLLLKRSAFNYETEFRFLVTVNTIPEEKVLFIPIEWSELIEKVEVDKDMSEMELDVLVTYLQSSNVPDSVIRSIVRSNLYEDPIEKIKIEP